VLQKSVRKGDGKYKNFFICLAKTPIRRRLLLVLVNQQDAEVKYCLQVVLCAVKTRSIFAVEVQLQFS
jgi:hypothetical protein